MTVIHISAITLLFGTLLFGGVQICLNRALGLFFLKAGGFLQTLIRKTWQKEVSATFLKQGLLVVTSLTVAVLMVLSLPDQIKRMEFQSEGILIKRSLFMKEEWVDYQDVTVKYMDQTSINRVRVRTKRTRPVFSLYKEGEVTPFYYVSSPMERSLAKIYAKIHQVNPQLMTTVEVNPIYQSSFERFVNYVNQAIQDRHDF